MFFNLLKHCPQLCVWFFFSWVKRQSGGRGWWRGQAGAPEVEQGGFQQPSSLSPWTSVALLTRYTTKKRKKIYPESRKQGQGWGSSWKTSFVWQRQQSKLLLALFSNANKNLSASGLILNPVPECCVHISLHCHSQAECATARAVQGF